MASPRGRSLVFWALSSLQGGASGRAKRLSPGGNSVYLFFMFRAQNLGGDLVSLILLSAPLLGDRSEDPKDLVSLAPLMT